MNNMLPVIYTRQGAKLDYIEDFSSFIWANRYNDIGDFEIVAPLTPKNLALLQIDNLIGSPHDEYNMCVVEKISILKDTEGASQIIASGRNMLSYLGRRIIEKTEKFVNKNIFEVIETLIMHNTQSGNRYLCPLWVYKDKLPSDYYNCKLSFQTTGANLLDKVLEICKANDYGILAYFEWGELDIYPYKRENYDFLTFSEKFENLFSIEYQKDVSQKVTSVLAAGAGEGEARKKVWSDTLTVTGLERYEIYKDIRDSSEDGLTEDEYLSTLKDSANSEITLHDTAINAEVEFSDYYKKKIYLGDYCYIVDDDCGVKPSGKPNAQLLEVIESIDPSGEYKVIPTFSINKEV